MLSTISVSVCAFVFVIVRVYLILCIFCSVFVVFKQKTAYDVRISDWSSDVCSSDLIVTNIVEHGDYTGNRAAFGRQDLVDAYLEELDDESDEAHGLSLEDFNLESESIGKHDKEKGDRGPASHIVTVK